MAEDRRISMGLNTDLPPDRLGDQAFRLQNVLPTSAQHVAPRPGVSHETYYEPQSLGRAIFADALPHDLGNGILITVINTTDDGDGTVTNTVDGIFQFRPRRIASDYDAVAGWLPDTTANAGTSHNALFGVVL